MLSFGIDDVSGQPVFVRVTPEQGRGERCRQQVRAAEDQYITSDDDRDQITASPLRATREQLTGLPPALVITSEADVLRDEGEAYAAKLRQADVAVTAVRYQGTVHDFVMLNSLRTPAPPTGR